MFGSDPAAHKKSPSSSSLEGLHPAFLALTAIGCPLYFRVKKQPFNGAGILTLESPYFLRLPVLIRSRQWLLQISSSTTAAGPFPIETGFPIKPLRAPRELNK